MTSKLRDIIAEAVCTYGFKIDQNSDGYRHIEPAAPTEPCEKICDHCWHFSSYILAKLEEWEHDK